MPTCACCKCKTCIPLYNTLKKKDLAQVALLKASKLKVRACNCQHYPEPFVSFSEALEVFINDFF